MKKYILIRLVVVVFVITGLLLTSGAYAMLHNAYLTFKAEAIEQIEQIEEILAENDEAVKDLQNELKSDFLIRAKAAAYMIQYNQDIIYDIEQLEHIISLLQIDEIHLFTHEGEIYSGNIPEYYGFTFDSGEQMRFFAPLLDDYELELAQDVTPNTAEEKEMQYVAVWSEDRQHIVQIGIEPLRLLEAMEETELSYIFSRLTHSSNSAFFAVDSMSGEIIVSTNEAITGAKSNDLGFSYLETEDVGTTQSGTIDGKSGHVLLLKQEGDSYIGYFESYMSVYGSALVGISFLVAISLGVATLIIVVLYFIIDRVILRGLSELEKGMELIASGDLNYKMAVSGLPEFEVLSDNVNFMVKRVVESSQRFSTIFEYINIPIAMYECKSNAVIATGKLEEILQINKDSFKEDFKSPVVFLGFIEEIMSHPCSSEQNLYVHSTENGERFLKIVRYQDGESDWGLIMDATEETVEKNIIKKERDLDYLTGLYGKRAFFERLEALSNSPEEIKKAAVIMFDLDNLKYVNDTWGHDTGDKFIFAAANVLRYCEHDQKLCTRLSGDELAMVLYGVQEYQQLEEEIEKIKEQFSKSYIITPTGVKHKVSASMGYSLYPQQEQSLRICLNYADKAMYAAKSKCKGSIEKYEPSAHYENNNPGRALEDTD